MSYNKQNTIIYIVFILIAFIGIYFGNAIYEK
jgi:hypothetical protein